MADDDAPAEKPKIHQIIDLAHLELFLQWQSLKGPQDGLSFSEIKNMPAGMRKDFTTFMRYIHRRMRSLRQEKQMINRANERSRKSRDRRRKGR